MTVAVAVVAACVLLLLASLAFARCYGLGAKHANQAWVEKASFRGGMRKECNGALYWVVDASDHKACNILRETLENEQDQRENTEALQRLRGF